MSEVRVRTRTSEPRILQKPFHRSRTGQHLVEFKNTHFLQDRLYQTTFMYVATLPLSDTLS